ncbi:MAG: cysteine desulfurase [Alphaproteobacteria bacterium]|nr:cysteine desulfurase [Alphaproteobacteria bacterium]
MREKPIYMDHNATVPVRPAVAEAVAAAFCIAGNASSVHSFGRGARNAIETAREQVARLVGLASADQIVFTSGGTEANNLALKGSGRDQILVSAIEHDSVLSAASPEHHLPVDELGRCELDRLADKVVQAESPTIVSIMLANNETGVVQPVSRVAEIAHRAGALVHSDAVQAAGKMHIDFEALGVDMLSLSAHKIGGPQGIGALVVRDDVDLSPTSFGGGQERRRRAGTENLPGIVGFGVAAEIAAAEIQASRQQANWRDALEAEVMSLVPAARIAGDGAERLPNTTCLITPGMSAETQVMALDLAGIAVSAGAACSSGKVAPSHVLRAMGYDESSAASAIRISLGWTSKRSDIDRFVSAWRELVARTGGLPSAA